MSDKKYNKWKKIKQKKFGSNGQKEDEPDVNVNCRNGSAFLERVCSDCKGKGYTGNGHDKEWCDSCGGFGYTVEEVDKDHEKIKEKNRER